VQVYSCAGRLIGNRLYISMYVRVRADTLGLYFEQRVAVSASVFMRRTTDWKSALYQHVCACSSRLYGEG
jgi:hypothetical protein